MTHVKDLFSLEGQVALVTGGAGTLGRSLCEALAGAGAHVIVASRNQSACAAVADQLLRAGLTSSAEQYDQSSEESTLALCSHLLERHGRIDVLVNNAVARPMTSMESHIQAWRESLEANATGLFILTREIVDSMMARGAGSVINISSIQGVAAPAHENYAGTAMSTPPDYHFHKHGMIGLTKYMAAIGGPRGVRVNAISPGGIENEEMPESFMETYRSQVPLGRLAHSDDFNGAVIFLASSASNYITGQNLIIDGGYTC